MKVITDDEESSIILGGGKVSPEQREEYMVHYYGIIDARKAGDKEKEKECADKLLYYLYTFVINEINDLSDNEKEYKRLKEEGYSDEKIPSMLFTPSDIKKMNEDVVKIWESIDPEETDHILKVNLVSMQYAYMFNDYTKNIESPGKTTATTSNLEAGLSKRIYTNYKLIKKSPVLNEYVTGYTSKLGQLEIYYLINSLPYTTITDMIEAWFIRNIWIVGFSTRNKYVDGDNWQTPIFFLTHDYGHANFTFECYSAIFGEPGRDRSNENMIKTYNLIREFYEYIKEKYNSDKPTLYSIKLLLFVSFHELGDNCLNYFSNASNQDRFKMSLWWAQQNTFSTRFSNENDLFLSLPGRIQAKAKDSKTNIIDKEEIKKYFSEECIPNYTKALHDFQKTKGMITGGRKTRKRKMKRNKRKTKTRK
jgi:hypothetical protein